MSVITWIIFGLIAGAIAKALFKGPSPGGWVATIIIGILGALLGGSIGSMILGIDVTGFNLSSFIIAVGGSVLLLAIYRSITKKKD